MKIRGLALLLLVLSSSSYAYPFIEKSSTDSSTNLPDLSITIVEPAAGALSGNNLKVIATVSSTFEIQSVKAFVEGREGTLVFSNTAYCGRLANCKPGWVGNVSLSGLPKGEKIVTVVVTDVSGNTAQAQRDFIYDEPPSLTVDAPLNEMVARPSLFVDARCTDDGPAGCTSLTITDGDNGPVLAQGQSSITGDIFLSAYDGKNITLVFKAKDARGQITSTTRQVFVESSDKLTEVETVGGRILAVEPDRILFLETTENAYILKIRDRASGQDTVVVSDPVKVPQYGFLTPKGAIFMSQDESGSVLTSRIIESRDGTLVDLGQPNSASSLKVKGNYAIWSVGETLIRRDLVSGTNVEVATDVGNWKNDVTAQGDVVYWNIQASAYNIYRYSGGTSTKLTDNANSLVNTYPLTDGINIVYRKHTLCCFDTRTFAIVLYTSSGEVTLAPARTQEPSQYSDYQVNGGWAAFTRLGNGPLQVWTRSPSGVDTQLSFFSTSSFIKGLSPTGGVIFSNSTQGRSYLKEPDAPLIDLHSTLGQDFWLDGQWYVTIGRTLFRVNTSPDPAPALLMEDSSSQRAIALNAVTLTRSPFPVMTGPPNLSPDQNTRLMLLATNISLMPGDNTSAILVQAEDSQHRLYSLPVEYIGKVPNFDWLTQINVRLPAELQGVGDIWVSINVRGAVTSRRLVNIQQ